MNKIVIVIIIIIASLFIYNTKDKISETFKVIKTTSNNIINKSIFRDNTTLVDGGNPNEMNINKTKYWENNDMVQASNMFNNADLKTLQDDIANKIITSSIDAPKSINYENNIDNTNNLLDYDVSSCINCGQYLLKGVAYNPYYEQYYLLYEKTHEINTDRKLPQNNEEMIMNKLYDYILAKKDGDKIKVIHKVNPRNKINDKDIFYIANGVFQLGPLTVSFK